LPVRAQPSVGPCGRKGTTIAFSIPDGTTIFLGTTFGTPVSITAISNAATAVVTSAAHGLSAGDIIIVKSGWQRINERVFRVANPLSGTFELEGMDTSDTSAFPAGTSAGSATEVLTFTQITQVLGLTTSGGDQQFATVSPLESDFETQIPTNTSAQSVAMDIGDDPSLAGYQALKKAADARAIRPLLMQNKNGSKIYYYGYTSLNETPTKNKGQVDTVKSSFSLLSRPVRYAA
jgi:hypothetical protein